MSNTQSSFRSFAATFPGLAALSLLSTVVALCGFAPQAWAAPVTSTTTLAVTSLGAPAAAVNWHTVVTLTAAVQALGAPVRVGLVDFCDATSPHCTGIHLLDTAQLTSAGTATFSLAPAIGTHSYKAVFVGTKVVASSASAAASLKVTGIPPTTSTVELTGTPGDYTLETTVSGTGPLMPTGTVAYLDTSNNNALLGTATLGKGIVEPLNLYPAPSLYSPGGSVVIADFNGDGFLDLAYTGGNSIVVLLGNGDGTFSTQVQTNDNFLQGYQAFYLAASDFNGDGIPDLAVADFSSADVNVLLGNGDGTFTPAQTTSAVGTYPSAIVAADFNNDGVPDLAVVNSQSASVTILLGNGDGTFTPAATNPAVGLYPTSIAAGDFNGDGKIDIAVGASNGLTVLLGNGDGTFKAAPPSSGTTGSYYSVAVGDFNGDGKPDLGLGTVTGLTVVLGNGDGSFKAAPASVVDGLNLEYLAVGDFNADGIPDLAGLGFGPNSQNGAWVILLGKGDGTFSPVAMSPSANNSPALAVGDFNGDGRSDLAAGNYPPLLAQQVQKVVLSTDGISPIGGGTHLVMAVYSGDANNIGSASATVPVIGERLEPKVTLGSSASQITVGAPITLTASAKGATLVPTGTATFYAGVSLLGSASLSNAGVATLTTSALPAGQQTLTAVYQGDTDYFPEVSNPISVTVNKGAVTVKLTANPTSISAGKTATFVAALTGERAKPTGKVTFFNGKTPLGTVAVSSATATYAGAKLAAGSYSITASYTGDANYKATTSTAVKVTVR